MLIDIHCHLTDQLLYKNLNYIIEESKSNNMLVLVTAGLNPKDNRKILEISKIYEAIKPALGLYPLDALSLKDDEINEELKFIYKNKKKIMAISEVGLDYFYSNETKKQKEIFQKFIELSEKISKPLIIHSRKAEDDIITMLESSNVKNPILHSFSGNKNLIKKAADKKFYFSIPPLIVRSSNFQTLVNIVSSNLLLTESDSPYQSAQKNTINRPIFVKETIKKIAEIKKLDFSETENIIFMNFQKIFKKWKTI